MKPLLIEIGCEELPAGASARLVEAFAERIKARLLEAGVAIEPRVGVTPRRLLVHARCPERTPPRERIVWGPPVRVAFDEGGNPTPAAQGFARKVGVALDALEQRLRPPKNEAYLAAVQQEPGRSVAELLAEALPELLRALPMPKRMRWAQGKAREDAFLRPIRWIVARLGKERIPFAYAGVESGFVSFGHRVHGAQGEMDPEDPFGWLEAQYVIADRETRMARIREQIQQLARAEGLSVVEDAELLEEVADLTEWPKALLCRFDAEFLRLPEAVIRTTLKHHQRCFALRKPDGGLAPAFIAVANLEPPEPRLVAKGNERVVRARLSDAAFYFDRDPEIPLPRRVPMLEGIVFQAGLGTMRDLAERLSFGTRWLAEQVAADAELAARAALLAKADLTTGLVGEFPELQGTIGGVYAEMAGEPEAVAEAIREHYLPEGGDDALPRSLLARLIG
ncbi:MAG: glycine--tRNA ligase subunit beta, partial [Zetaproteobacteria bacterium]